MMKIIPFLKIVFFTFLSLYYNQVSALYLSADIASMSSSEEFLSKPYINNTETTNLYEFSAYKIDKPGKVENELDINNGEIIFTPLKKILLPNEQEFFKIFYNGEKDNKERYYKIIISESPLNMVENSDKNKNPIFYPTVNLETYFIVRPKKPKFKHHYDAQKGILTNTGNTYFRVLLHPRCEIDNGESPDMLYLLPGESYKSDSLKIKSRKYIVVFDRYQPIDSCDK